MSRKRDNDWIAAETLPGEGEAGGTVRMQLPQADVAPAEDEALEPDVGALDGAPPLVDQDTHVGAAPQSEAAAEATADDDALWDDRQRGWADAPQDADYGAVLSESDGVGLAQEQTGSDWGAEPWAGDNTAHEVLPVDPSASGYAPADEVTVHEVDDAALVDESTLDAPYPEGGREPYRDGDDIFEVKSQDLVVDHDVLGRPEDVQDARGGFAGQRGFADGGFAEGSSATPFAVATDELLLGDLSEGAPLTEGVTGSVSADGLETNDAVEGEGYDDEPYWRERVVALQEQQKLVRNTRREPELLRELGRIYDQCLADSAAAIDAYERLLAQVPGDDEAFHALDRLFQEGQHSDKLAELLLDRQDHVEDVEQKAELLGRVAELYARGGDRERAEVVLDAALSLAPGHPGVMAAAAALAEAEAGEQPAATPPPAPVEAPPPPPPPKDPVEELEERLAEAASDSERVDILDKLATLYLRQDAPQRAAECLQQVISLDRRRDSAYRRLAAIYRQHERFDDLARVLELHARAAPPEPRVELLRQLAELYEGHLGDGASAMASYERIRELSPADPAALRALWGYHEQSYQQGADPGALLTLLADMANRLRGPERLEVLGRQGQILEEALQDPLGAEECYQRALEQDPAHGPSILALTEIYRARGDWGKAVRMMRAAEAASSSPAQKSRFLYEAGKTSLEQLEDIESALALLFRCLEVDPDHQGAAEVLAELLYERGELDRLGPVLEVLLRKTPRDDVPRLTELNHKLAAVAEANGDAQRALGAYRKALSLDGSHVPSLLGLAELAFAQGDHRQALDCYSRLGREVETLEPERQRVMLLHEGQAAIAAGDKTRARSALERGLNLYPGDAEILGVLSSLQLDGSDWHGALASKEALLRNAEGAEARKLLLEIGDIYRDKLRDADRAEERYRHGLELAKGADRVLLHRLLDLYSETSQWARTVEICEQLAAHEQEPRVQAKYFGVAASLCDKHLERPDDAIRFYNRALDVEPEELKAFSAIDAICTRLKDWKKLEQSYGKMIKRLPADGKLELKVMLWHNLGEVMRSRRRDYEGAIAAFEVALQLEPNNSQRRRILGELYLSCGPNYADKALATYQRLLEDEPRDVELYRTVLSLYLDAGRYDRAWALAAALCFLRKADGEAQEYHERYRRRSIPIARSRLTDDSWARHVYHPKQDPYLSGIFAILAGPVGAMTARSHSSFGLKRKDRYDYHSQQDHPFCRLFVYLQGVLHAPPFDLFLDPQRQASLQLAHTSEATTLVAGSHVLSAERAEKELAFLVAKQLAFLRPDMFLRVALPAKAQLQGALLAACVLVNPRTALPPGEEKAIQKSADKLKKQLAYPQIERLGSLLRRLENPERVDLGQWWDAVDLSTDRVAMLLCNDVETAARLIASEPSASGLSSRGRAEELVRFACSESYFRLREELSITIEDG